jgi:choline dehydrogenase-like flavoprotein
MGTTRMGADSKTSVTNANGQSHDHPNLWFAGSSLFPTSGTANPPLTIAALALRTAEAIKAAVRQ